MWTRSARAVWRCLRGAPVTFIWLALLLSTTIVQHHVSPDRLDALLTNRSTNIDHLTSDPARVIFASLFWLDGSSGPAYWFPYAVAFIVFHVPAERWLGTLRWLAIGLSAHLLATFISEGALAVAIRWGLANESMRDTQDVGVSYFLAAIVAVLTFHIADPWRWVYFAGVLVAYSVPLIVSPTFTALGHFSSVLIGFACYPIARGTMDDDWDPMTSIRRITRRLTRSR